MNLFHRDYSKLSASELLIVEKLEEKTESFLFKDYEKNRERIALIRENPFVLNYKSFFPSNYLNEIDLVRNQVDYIRIHQKFKMLLDAGNISERDILNFVKAENAYFIIGSILKQTSYGHHDRYIFAEIQLPPNYQADYLLIGKNSHGYNFLFVELENPTGSIILQDGSFGAAIRKGLNQVEDWKIWNESNLSSLRGSLQKLNVLGKELPKEFFEYDSSRYEYAVVAGRRSDFNDKSNRARRRLGRDGIYILHYDNLLELSEKLIKSGQF